jgi:transcription factor 1
LHCADDIIKYIGPSLEKYKGCDIIDLNPGACLWSQKLHDFLQPRTHVLFESSPQMWSDFQRPLLDKPNSAYALFHGDMVDRKAFEELFSSGILPHQKAVDPEDPESQQPNNNLLVTGSLMWDPKAQGMGFDSLGKQLVTLFSEGAWINKRYHKYGPVRSLLWMTEEDFKGAVPRSHYMYTKYSFIMNYLTKTVQVVTPGHAPKGPAYATIGRKPQYEIQSVIRAMQRGQENGMELPKHRRDCVHEMADEIAQLNLEQGKPVDTRLSTEEMIQYLEQRVLDGKSNVGIDLERDIKAIQARQHLEVNPHLGLTLGKRNQPKKNDLGIETARYMAVLKQIRKHRVQSSELAEAYEEMFDRECEICTMKDGPEKEEAKRALEDQSEELEAAVAAMHTALQTGVISEANDRITLKSPVTRLQWDARPYEPLVMQPDEVWPAKSACLIDLDPHPRRTQRLDMIIDFAYALFQSPNRSVKKALDSMQSGASTLVDQVPSLTDPQQGGRLNLDHLKVSMLTNEMITDLFQAYSDWPFKDGAATHSKYFHLKQRGRQMTG